MNTVRARLAALLASLLLAQLAGAGLVEVSPELSVALERWLAQSIELAVLLGHALVERRKRSSGSSMIRNRPCADPRPPR